ncbi:MAG: Gfo/Idh/MocA family oxidoreductase [Azospirillaceae bacterium]|nr:Gfo/Idh/MocA family oxidoreductase [Azospirillaceae bacterium]
MTEPAAFRCVVIGLGVQGEKRRRVAGKDCIGTVDPVNDRADWRDVGQIPADAYDAALVCTPDVVKPDLLRHLLRLGKHVLVEKPLVGDHPDALTELAAEASRRNLTLYTAYNHRFEPHFVRMKALLDGGGLGRIYRCRMSYGNGTARDVRNSAWRDKDPGVLADLGSHLLDTVLFWFGDQCGPFRVVTARRYENNAFDHVVIASDGVPGIELEMSLLSWRNDFTCDIVGEAGSAHIRSLCKWGPSSFIHRERVLPSGRPDEESTVLVRSDPTWEAEYGHFRRLCRTGGSNTDNDIWIATRLSALVREALTQ